MTTTENAPALIFALSPLMMSDDTLKEIHVKTTISTLSNKTTLQVIIVVVMSYERICSTARTVAAAAGVVYVTHTLVQYQTLIDRITHATYIDTVLVGVPHAHVDPFGEDLAEAADDLQCSFDGFIAHNHYNNVCYQHHKCCPARKD